MPSTAAASILVPADHERDVFIYLALKEAPERAVVRLKEEYPNDAKVARCIRLLQNIGKPCAFKFTAMDGRKIDSRDYVGKVVLMEFWARDCSPCVAAMPQLKMLADQFGPRGFEIVGINTGDSRHDAESVIKKFSLPWPQLLDGPTVEHSFADRFMVIGIPTGVLIDRRGNLRYLQVHPTAPDSIQRIEELLAEKNSPAP